MHGTTLESKILRLEILPEGQELVKEVIDLASSQFGNEKELSNSDLAVVVGDALMYYKILLEHKSKGGDVILKLDNQETKLPVIASLT